VITAAGRTRPATVVPAWFLLPGLGALLASVVAYVQYQRYFPAAGFDLDIYRDAVQAFRAGRPVYDLTFALGLPYTYPPITLSLLTPLSTLEAAEALPVMTALSLTAVFLTVWFVTGLTGYRGIAGRTGVAGAVTGLALWLEPVSSNLSLGQVNAVLMLLVVADLAAPDRVWLKGAGIGVATACKLVPGIFVVYLVLTRRLRAATVAAAAFVLMTIAGCVTAPEASDAYWLHGLFLDPSRVAAATGPGFVANQSVRGFLLRSCGNTAGAAAMWVLLALAIIGAGLTLARLAHRRGEEAVAVVTVAFTALLVSPVSWSHHWVWVAVLLPVLLDVVLRNDGRVQTVASGLLPAWTLMLLTWPLPSREDEPPGANGIIWVAHLQSQPLHWFGENMYVLAVVGTMLLGFRWLREDPDAWSVAWPVQRRETGAFGPTQAASRGSAITALDTRSGRSWPARPAGHDPSDAA
jgi:alpha-1,2-mannosyltransferase